MAGNLNNREENYEIKYLRKMLMPIDNRIQVPQSIDASSLRSLLDDIEPASLREAARRRPRWLSLQSGIAYAAAFALIVALFYSMEIYKPDIIDGGMRIAQQAQSSPVIVVSDVPDHPELEPRSNDNVLPAAITDALIPSESETIAQLQPSTNETTAPAAFSASGSLGVGGGGNSILLLEQDNYEYRWRANDASDPDRTSPVTLEIIEKDSQEFALQLHIDGMNDIQRCFVLGDMLMLVGTSDSGIASQVYYDPANPTQQISLSQSGTLVDARLYKDIVHVVSLSDVPYDGGDAVALPNADASETCIITAVNLSSLETSRKAFTGAKGTIQLHSLNAYIHYEGHDEDGSQKNYIGQILLDGMDIELGPVT